ncbi:MAG: PPC domain-containing protein, partial [Treponema sp.]|nr:PPC domain-containing protein [Treponema sp.]
ITCIMFVYGVIYAQESVGIVVQMDEAVSALAVNIHEKLAEKNAEKILIGQFTFNDGITPFSTYWANQLISELTNMPRRNYSVLNSGSSNEAGWTVTGEIVQVSDVVRIYTRLVRTSDRSIEASFFSSFQRNDVFDMISSGASGGGSSSQGGTSRDAYEPDSWDNPAEYAIGTNSNAAVMNRALTAGDEDFFLLVPDRNGLLTIETTGGLDTFMYLYNYEWEEELETNDDGGQGTNARITYNVEAGVAYIAIVEGYSSSASGPYGFRAYLTVREGASAWGNPVTHEISPNEENAVVLNRAISQGFPDYFLIIPEISGRVTAETTGRTDTFMELYEADTRHLLDENDDGGTNYNARITFTASAGERYIIVVKGFSSNTTGNYGFRTFYSGGNLLAADRYEQDNEPSSAKIIEIGETQERTFHTAYDVDWMRFQITNAGRYVINARGVTSNRLDTYIELFDSDLNVIAEDDDGGDALSSRLTVNLNSGTYYLKVWCLDEEPYQGYTVNISAQ